MERPTRIVAIDGPAGSGKSTTARMAAERLGVLYMDTGALYRAITLGVLDQGVDPSDEAALAALVGSTAVTLEADGAGPTRVWLDDRDVTDEIRTQRVSAAVSTVSASPAVRAHLVELQRRLAARGDVVVEGRDIGTVVFPDADAKFFLVADLAERASRRLGDLRGSGNDTITRAEVEESLRVRDETDSARAHSPLRKASDATEIDTSGLTVEETVDRVVEHIRQVLRGRPEGPGERPPDRTSNQLEEPARIARDGLGHDPNTGS